MERVDGIEESRRLQEFYAQLTDEALQATADEGYQLTDTAKEALQAEILTRGLKIKLKDAPRQPGFPDQANSFDPSDLDLVVVQRVWDIDEARQLKRILDDARIPSYLGPNNLESVDDYKGTFENGIDLKVREVDDQLARAAISQSSPQETQNEEAYIPVCPKCHSDQIVFQSLDTSLHPDSAFDAKFNWSCDACGHQWKDDGIEKSA
jgi:DNA-directed RNA polymerase subunit M/transcription elongation factor TFIIS